MSAVALASATEASPSARAETPLYDVSAGRFGAELEVVTIPWDGGEEFDDLDPLVLFGVSASYFIADEFSVLAVFRGDITDPEADTIEFGVGLAWSYVGKPAMTVPPALRLGARLELGWRFLELHGGDFQFDEQGLTVTLSGDVGLVVFEGFSLVARLAFMIADSDHEFVVPDPGTQLRPGIAFQGVF